MFQKVLVSLRLTKIKNIHFGTFGAEKVFWRMKIFIRYKISKEIKNYLLHVHIYRSVCISSLSQMRDTQISTFCAA